MKKTKPLEPICKKCKRPLDSFNDSFLCQDCYWDMKRDQQWEGESENDNQEDEDGND